MTGHQLVEGAVKVLLKVTVKVELVVTVVKVVTAGVRVGMLQRVKVVAKRAVITSYRQVFELNTLCSCFCCCYATSACREFIINLIMASTQK